MKRIAIVSCATLIVSGCATAGLPGLGGGSAAWTPTIDMGGVDQAHYEQDFAECRAYAEANPSADADAVARQGGLRSGLGLAALSAGAAVATGGLSMVPMLAGTILVSGAGGAVVGAGAGRLQAQMAHRQIITTCLEGRGYTVLN